MRLLVLVLSHLLIGFSASAASQAQVFSIDPCDVLIRKKGNLSEVLQPRHRALDLIHRIQLGEEIHIVIGQEDQTEISIQAANTPDRAPVMVKTHATAQIANRSAEVYGQLKEFKDKGLLPGFQLFEHIKRDDRTNIFKFEEGRELISMPGDLVDLSNRDLVALQKSYSIRLNHTRAALERAGATVEIYKLDDADLPSLIASHNDSPLIHISPYQIWVTIDGRFLIFDPL